MKIMIVNTYYFPEIFGGAEYSVKKLAEELYRQGHEVRVLCTGEKYSEECVDGICVIRIRAKNLCRGCESAKYPVYKRVIRRTLDIWNPFNKSDLAEVIKKFQPDVIHTNGLYDISPIVWYIAKKNGCKVVHTLRDYHLLCPFTSLHCVKVGAQCPDRPPKLFCKLHRMINKKATKYVDVVTAPSVVTLNLLLNRGFFSNSRSKMIPNAIEYNGCDIKELLENRKKKNNDGINFVYLGTLSEQKGIRWMISSFKRLPKTAKLYIAGKGNLQEYVIEEASQDRRIHYVGFLDENAINNLLSECDVLICPSQWQEPFGRVVLDAYKHAMPVISSDQGALPTLVKDNITGFVVKSGDEKMLTDAMQRFMDRPDLICEYAARAVDELQYYSLEKQAKSFCDIY